MNTHRMLKLTAALLLTLAVLSPAQSRIRAQETTVSANLEDLKTRLATKVAELRTVVKRAMYGTVKSVSVTQATIETKTKDIKIELTDDVLVTQILSGKRTTLSIDDIEVKDRVTVFGSYDETLDLLKAQFVFIEPTNTSIRITGSVADIDNKDFILTVTTREGRSITVDIEKSSKTVMWTKEAGIVKGGFSKISVGDTVHITGSAVPNKENRMRAVRILDLGNITGAPQISPTSTPESSPSSTPKP